MGLRASMNRPGPGSSATHESFNVALLRKHRPCDWGRDHKIRSETRYDLYRHGHVLSVLARIPILPQWVPSQVWVGSEGLTGLRKRRLYCVSVSIKFFKQHAHLAL